MKPYMPEKRLTEDPLDGTHPPRAGKRLNRKHKKGERQAARRLIAKATK